MFIIIVFDSVLARSLPMKILRQDQDPGKKHEESAGFLLFSPKGSVTGCDSLLGSFSYSQVYFLSRMHLHSCYYYYNYVISGVLRPSGPCVLRPPTEKQKSSVGG